MISFNKLGNLGRLGNQMFQYSAIKAISHKHNYRFVIPPKNNFGKEDEKVRSDINSTIYDVFCLSEVEQGLLFNPVIMEATHAFDSNLFEHCPDNVDLMGYFQTDKYFKLIEDDIRNDFKFKDHILNTCQEFLNRSEYISLHIRRGDYINLQHYHPLITLEYYEKGLSMLPDLPVLIFSDDTEWCNNQDLFSSDRFMVSESKDTGIDLCLMSMCKYHIIANSSLSWWGSYLARSEKTIAPNVWFHKDRGIDNGDKYLKNWIVI